MSATIYQFPAGGRAAQRPRREQEKSNVVASPAITACGSAWYHDEAIKEEEPTSKH